MPVSKIISDIFLVAAVVAGPVLLGLLYVYGIRATNQKDRQPHSRDATDQATKALYAQSDAERERREKEAQHSSKTVDVIERKTGTTG